MKTRINTKIIVHWILVILITGLLLYFNKINTDYFLILIVLFLLTLIFNRTTYVHIKGDKLKITKRNFLIISTFKLSIDISKIDKLSVVDCKDSAMGNTRWVVDFEATILADILSGAYFYKPKYKLIIASTQNDPIEIEVNTKRNEIRKIMQKIKKSWYGAF